MTLTAAPPEDHPPARMLICGFGSFPGFADNPASGVVERLRAADWAPQGIRAAYQLIPTTWRGGHAAVAEAAAAFMPDAILVLGVAGGADAFRVETQGRNCAGTDRPDALGVLHAEARISANGPGVAQTTAPVEAMVAAIAREGLPVGASTDAGDYLCNYVFYRLLTEAAAPVAAFLHLPPSLGLGDLERGTRAAAAALADSLSPATSCTRATAGR